MTKMPITIASVSAGARNCHTDTPDARTTTSSFKRVRRMNVQMAPNRTAKGSAVSERLGSFKSAMVMTMPASRPLRGLPRGA